MRRWLIWGVGVVVVAVAVVILLAPAAEPVVRSLFARADIQINGNRPWDIQVHDNAFYGRVLQGGSLAFGEAYMDGLWDCDDLAGCIQRVCTAQLDEAGYASWSTITGYLKAACCNLQSRSRSQLVIDQHYQLGNDLYVRMLDPTMTYSCGYWKDARTLKQAQLAKYDLICRKLGLQPGMRVLDIGCGWGGFAHYAASNYGAHVVGVTLSSNQAAYARSITSGLPVEIRIQDYRDLNESFDRIIEIGMFEHVGAKNYKEFMEVVHRCLTPGGLCVLHTIGSNTTALGTDPWIDRYIFPNGHLPSVVQVGKSIEGLFVMEDWHNFGTDYARTLHAWWDNFDAHWGELSAQYGERFYRMWRYYLLSCEGSFEARTIQLWQVVLSKEGVSGGYESVR